MSLEKQIAIKKQKQNKKFKRKENKLTKRIIIISFFHWSGLPYDVRLQRRSLRVS